MTNFNTFTSGPIIFVIDPPKFHSGKTDLSAVVQP
jgi:hypothetical protein